MSAWIADLLTNIVLRLISFLGLEIKKGIDHSQGQDAQAKIDAQNEQKYKDAVASGDHDEILKKATDALNGVNPPSPKP